MPVPCTVGPSRWGGRANAAGAFPAVQFNPGQAYELNNAAKHAVENGGAATRIHMILDWVEDAVANVLPPPLQLTKGQLIKQVNSPTRGR